MARYGARQWAWQAKGLRERGHRMRAHSQISLSPQPSGHTGILGVRRDVHEARTPRTRLQHHEPPAGRVGGEPATGISFGRSARRRGFDRLEGLWRWRVACGEIQASRPKGLAEVAL